MKQPSVKDRIIEMYKKGKNKHQISNDIPCNRRYVYTVLEEAGLYSRNKSKS